jgi:CPA2 family monovalent cation:H+ antiporter-2
VNEPILKKAHVDTADIVVISVGSLIPSMAIVERVRHLNKNVHIIVRASTVSNIEQLYKAGADQVIPEKLEIAIDILNRILVQRLVPQKEVNRILAHIRTKSLGEYTEKDLINQPSILDEFSSISIVAIKIEPLSQSAGKSLVDIDLRKNTGVTLLAIKRGNEIMEHPSPETVIMPEDTAYVIGNPEQINFATEMFSGKSN